MKSLTDENGLLDQMGEAVQTLSDRLSRNLGLAQVGLRRVGNKLVRRRRGPETDLVEIANDTVANLDRINDALRAQRSQTRQGLGQVDAQIRKIRKGGVTDEEREQYQNLIASRRNFQKRLDDLDGQILQNEQDRFEARTQRFEERTKAMLRGGQEGQRQAELAGRFASALGQEGVGAQAAQAQLEALREQQRVLGERVRSAREKARRDPRWQSIADDLQQQFDDITGQVVEQIHQVLQNSVDAVNNDIERRQTGVGVQQRIYSALGRRDILPNLAQQSINLMNEQIGRLQELLPSLVAAGDQGLVQQVSQQINDLQAQVVEATVQMFNDAVENFDRGISRRRAGLDIAGRFLDVRERAGDRLGAAQSRIGLSDQRLGLLNQEYQGIAQLRMQALAQGNIGAFEDLSDRLADLGAQIAEENQTRRDLVYAYRQTATELITGRGERATGLIGVAGQIVQKLGEISGTQDTATLIRLARETLDTLHDTGRQIARNVADSIAGGEFGAPGGSILARLQRAFQDSPQAFANTLADLGDEIAALESTMGDTQKTAFQALIQAMIDNTTSVLDNTKSLNDLLGIATAPQTFSSTAWQWFREAIFSGMGDVLPQYSVPGMQTGGYVTRGGLFRLHAGEFVVNPQHPGSPALHEGDINITVNEKEGRIDEQYLASRLAFERKVARANT
jgi:hypothetical protein